MHQHVRATAALLLLSLLACGEDQENRTGQISSEPAGQGGAGAGGQSTGGASGAAGSNSGTGGVATAGTAGGGGASGGAGGSSAAGMAGAGGPASPYFARILGDSKQQACSSVASIPGGSIWFGALSASELSLDELMVSSPSGEYPIAVLGQVDRAGQGLRLRSLGLPGQVTIPYRLAPAEDGGVYGLMIQRGPVDMGLGVLVKQGESGAVVVRFDPEGTPLWQQLIGVGDEKKMPLFSSLVAVPGGGVVATSTPQRRVQRLDASGATVWERILPTTVGTMAMALQGEQVILVGTASTGSVETLSFQAQGDVDGVVLSLELASGEPVSVRGLGAAGASVRLQAVAPGPDGSLLVGGSYLGTFLDFPLAESFRPLWARLPGEGAPAWVHTASIVAAPLQFSVGTIPEVMVDAGGQEHVVLFERGTFDAGQGSHASTDFENVADVLVLDLASDGTVARQRWVASGSEDDVGRYEMQAQADGDGLVMAGSFRVKAGTALGDEEASGKGQIYVTRLPP